MKKIISLITALTLICTSLVFTVSADEFDYSMYEKEINILTQLGITTSNDAGASNQSMVTRAELAALAVKALGYDGISLNAGTGAFEDVSPSHWAYRYIMFAQSIKLFNGTSATTFSPDAAIDASQAVATMVKMLNYAQMADAKGGYPSGYWIVAGSCGILDGAGINQSGTITREQLYILLYNTVHADMLVADGFLGEDTSYVKDGSTILSNYLHIHYIDGVLTADSQASISGALTSSEVHFNVGNIQFKTNDTAVTGKTGRNVRVYYKDNGTAVFDAVCVWDGENKEVTLSSDSIADFDYAAGIYKAIDGDKEKSYKIGKNYYLSYNGEAIPGSDPALMRPASGHITLIDNNRDSIYDVVAVKEYYNLVFSGYDKYSNVIYDKLDSAKNIDLDSFFTVSSNVEDYSSVPQKSIFTVYKSKSGSSVQIHVSENTAGGKITNISSQNEYTIKDNSYKLSLAHRGSGADKLRAGLNCVFYLDAYNTIAYYEIIPDNQSGYLLQFAAGTGLAGAQAQMLTLDGSLKAFELADKVTLETPSGTSRINGSEVSGYFSGLTGSNRLYVLFNQNDAKQINRITLPKVIKTQAEYDSMGGYPLYKMDYYIYNWPEPTTTYNQYKSKNMGYGNWLIMDENTVVLNVVGETQMEYTMDDFMCGSVKSTLRPDETIVIKKDNEGSKTAREIDIYKIGDSGYTPDVLIKYDVPENRYVSDDGDFMVIKNLTQAVNPSTGNSAWKLTYIQGANEVTGFLSESFSNNRVQILSSPYASSITVPALSPLKLKYEVGDVVKISKNLSGEIINICLVYDNKNKTLSFPVLSAFNRIFRIIDGEVSLADNGFIEIKTSGGAVERSRIDGCNITVTDNFREEVTAGTMADIAVGDRVVIYSRYGDNKTVAVYKSGR